MDSKAERSVSYMPKWLVAAAALLVVLRVGDVVINRLLPHDQISKAEGGISWSQIPSREQLVAEAKRVATSPPKPVQELSPQSQEQLQELLAEAKSNGKLLLLEFYADWSDPCKKMESTSMHNSQVSDLVNYKFMPVRVNDTQKQFGVNARFVADLQKRYRVFAFPTLIIIGADESPIASLIGNCSSLTTYRFLSRALATVTKLRPDYFATLTESTREPNSAHSPLLRLPQPSSVHRGSS
ncbi:MAG: thioredoxin family protein [Candidatus Melainabacteria bacterium]|nr:thioredoxin family protein [Candidatus Melainabacteria bacterium]